MAWAGHLRLARRLATSSDAVGWHVLVQHEDARIAARSSVDCMGKARVTTHSDVRAVINCKSPGMDSPLRWNHTSVPLAMARPEADGRSARRRRPRPPAVLAR